MLLILFIYAACSKSTSNQLTASQKLLLGNWIADSSITYPYLQNDTLNVFPTGYYVNFASNGQAVFNFGPALNGTTNFVLSNDTTLIFKNAQGDTTRIYFLPVLTATKMTWYNPHSQLIPFKYMYFHK